MAKGGVVTEEQVISPTQYLDLIYTHFGTFYDKIPDAPRLEFSVPTPPKSKNESHVSDGVIGTTSTKSTKVTSKKGCKVSGQNVNEELLASEVNAVLTDKGKEPKKLGGKKKNKGTKKKQDELSLEISSTNPSGQRKPPSGCQIFNEDHWMKDCLHKAGIKKFFKNSKTSAVLTDPFPNPGTNLVASDNSSPSQVLMLSISK